MGTLLDILGALFDAWLTIALATTVLVVLGFFALYCMVGGP